MCIHFLQQRRPPILPCLQVCIIISPLYSVLNALLLLNLLLDTGNGADLLSSGR